MKKLFALLLVAGTFTFVACGPCGEKGGEQEPQKITGTNKVSTGHNEIEIITIRGCDYIFVSNHWDHQIDIIPATDCPCRQEGAPETPEY